MRIGSKSTKTNRIEKKQTFSMSNSATADRSIHADVQMEHKVVYLMISSSRRLIDLAIELEENIMFEKKIVEEDDKKGVEEEQKNGMGDEWVKIKSR